MTERLTYSIPEAARVLGLSENKVKQMVADGVLPLVPFTGRRKLIPKRRLDQWVNGEVA